MVKLLVQPPLESDICPVTGLPITRRPSWTNVELVEGYTATYRIIGDRILLTAPAGNAGREGVGRFFEVRERVLREGGLWDRDYVEIKDYAQIDPGHPRLGRMQFAQGMLNEGSRGHLKGFWGFNGSFAFRCIMNVAKHLIQHDGIPFTFVRDYNTAVLKAVELMRGPVRATGSALGEVVPNDLPDLEFIGESNRFRMHHARRPPGRAAAGSPRTYSDEEIEDLVSELLRFIGTINWNIEGMENIQPDPANPLRILYEAITVLKQDFDVILSEREELEGTIIHARKLASLGTLTAGFAHQLNNPLTAVIGFAQRIARRSTDQRSRDDAAVIVRAGSRMKALVDQLCQMNREQFFFERELIDVNQIILQALLALDQSYRTTDITVETDLERGLPPVYGNTAHFEGLFHALLVNAHQAHSRTNNRRDKLIRIATSRGGDSVKISFCDNACGMTESVRTRAFEPFFSTNSTGKETGLGMFISHQIVKEYGGEIQLHSEEGAGTTVKILFPLPQDRVGERRR